ncbi:hypothetical protein WG954_09415 [Lacibacter sp. H375]|uniref:hypothetical protein n=1 Tax=Lacibacter sp. H375 TaxID=3133424 RepID=UPI0030C0BCAE
MGFGFSLIFILIILPLTGILLLTWLITRKKVFGKILGLIWFAIIGFILLLGIGHWLTSKKEMKKRDYYGQYVVNRSYYPGKQADWQYENFRFEIRENDSIYFYVTNKEQVLKTYRGTVTTTEQYSSKRLIIKMEQPTHHIMTSNPTTYRSAWNFYLVFNSPLFNNLYFKKGKWKALK